MGALPTFLDFEASSLRSASYPIEVAWSQPDGSIESHLISPAGIGRWTDWSVEAEKLHGLSRAEVSAHGRAPAWVCRRLNEQLAGQIVYSDNPDYDGAWLAELFSVYYGGGPAFTIGHADTLLVSLLCPEGVEREQGVKRLEALKRVARGEGAGQHRAGKDVEYLVRVYKLVVESRRE